MSGRFGKKLKHVPMSLEAELLRAAEALEHVPQYPARTYFEACQSAWLLHLAFQLTDNYLALGRPDQYLYPFLKKDLESGMLSLEEAQEMTDCFMLKLMNVLRTMKQQRK